MSNRPSAEKLAADVRKVLTARARIANVLDADVAALDDLVALVGTLQQERDDWAQKYADLSVEHTQALRDADAAEAALAETRRALQDIIDRHERPCGVHEPPLPCDVALAETYAIARRALAATDTESA